MTEKDNKEKKMVDLTGTQPKKNPGLKGPLTGLVVLGGKEYTIRELPSKKNSEWRILVGTQMTMITSIVESALGADLQSPAGLAGVLTAFGDQVIGAFDTMRELCFTYSLDLRADQKRIENESYDSEIIPAFLEVLKLGFPFGSVASRILDLSTAVNSSTPR